MKYFSILFLSVFIFLSGCQKQAPIDQSKSFEFETEDVKKSAVGDPCGGQGGLFCGTGLECQFDEAGNSGGAGICVKSVTDTSLDCPDTKAPVCGLKGRVKNGYLNECEARRHGAEIIAESFCKKDEAVMNNCEAIVKAIGNCDTVFTGYENKEGKCSEFSITACDAEIPFATLEECKAKCE